MFRSTGLLCAMLLLSMAGMSQSQMQVPKKVDAPVKPQVGDQQNAYQIDMGTSGQGTVRAEKTTGPVNPRIGPSDVWVQKQADDLLGLLKCYLSDQSINNEISAETKASPDPKHMVEVRISLLMTLAKQNAASHCK